MMMQSPRKMYNFMKGFCASWVGSVWAMSAT